MKTIKAQELKRKMDHNEEVLVLDVLPSEHYETQHIPGAKSIPLEKDNFVDSVKDAAKNKQQQVVVYCASTECDLSPKAADRLESEGFENVVDFNGGIQEWKDAGYSLTAS